jgi:hypothetical protein
MTFEAFAGAEAGQSAANQGSGFYQFATVNDGIVAAPGGFPGAYSFSIDPVNGDANNRYGWAANILSANLFTVMFMYRFAADFDEPISIAEISNGNTGGTLVRRLLQNTSEELGIVDKDEDEVGTTVGTPYVAANTVYWILWYIDLRVEAQSRDMLFVWKAGAWDKAIDVSNHGDGDVTAIAKLAFGSRVGKGALPTVGGPFYVDEMARQVLNVSPNTTPLGSVTTKFKVPTANGTDGDFDTGTGDNPDWEDVNEIPPNGDTTYDEGDVTGDKQGYAIANADGGDTPLAVQVIGSASLTGTAGLLARTYLLESGTYDYATQYDPAAGYRILGASGAGRDRTFNEINGNTPASVFDACEAGVELVTVPGGRTLRLTQIGLEYLTAGPNALPGDFPLPSEPHVVMPEGGAALGSAIPGIY